MVRLLVLLMLLPNPALAEDSAKQLFQKGLLALQEGQLEPSREHLAKAWSLAPDNKFVLFNRGLAEHRAQNLGLAIALWRSALSQDPHFAPARDALSLALESLPGRPFSSRVGWREQVRSYLFLLDLRVWLALGVLSFTISGFFLIRYVGARRRALRHELPLPSRPWIALFGSMLWLLALWGGTESLIALGEPRATLVVNSEKLRTGPSSEDTALVEIYQGFDLNILNTSKDWAQVSYPGGFTGWVPVSSLFQTSGPKKW